MSAIAYYLEDEGIATTGISLVRENTESFEPPRFLWVSFPLGRPLGVPGDPEFQHRVIAQALSLLDAPRGPVLEDFPEDVPDAPPAVFACPVSFANPSTPALDDNGWAAQLTREVNTLSPWYQASIDARRHSTVGIVGESPQALAALVGSWLDGDVAAPKTVKHVLEDLKAFYLEAMVMQPGAQLGALNDWLWMETTLGQAMRALRSQMLASTDPRHRQLADALVPRWVLERHTCGAA